MNASLFPLSPRLQVHPLAAHGAAATRRSAVTQICLALGLVCNAAATVAQAQSTDISSTVDIDQGANYDVREETYSLPDALLQFPGENTPPGSGVPTEMLGVVVTPVNPRGPRPVAVFIHGMGGTCYNATTGEAHSLWPCAEGERPVPNYRGFLESQRFLAARGWVTVSVSQNAVGGSAFAQTYPADTLLRAELIEKHLQQWALWLAGDKTVPPPAFIAAGVQPNLQQLMLIGHSRGGSAANQVALKSVTDAASPWRARAQVLIGPVAAHYNPTPLLPTVVLLPGCDGDVTDLQGQSYIDRGRDLIADPALRSGIFIDGANHNFFNSEWDPATATVARVAKDDAVTFFEGRTPEGACRPGAPERLTGVAQRELGNFYIAAAGKAFVLADTAISTLFDGSKVCAGPTCRATIRTHALGGRRQPLLIPDVDSAASTSEQMSIAPCFSARAASDETACITADMPRFKKVPRTPHFTMATEFIEDEPPASAEPSLVALRAQWASPLGAARVRASHSTLSRDASQIAARVIVPPEAVDTSFALSLRDAAGAVLPLGTAMLSGVPANAGPGTGVYWAQEVRLPVDVAAAAAAGFDVNALEVLEITPRSESGLLWLLDAWSYAPGAAASTGSAARFEISSDPVELDASAHVRVSASVIGELRVPGEIYYYVRQPGEAGFEGTVAVEAGARTFTMTLPTPREVFGAFDVQFVGVKGMVATKKLQFLTLSGPAQE